MPRQFDKLREHYILSLLRFGSRDEYHRHLIRQFLKGNKMSEINLQVGNSYLTRDGRKATIVYRNANPSCEMESFVAALQSHTRPETNVLRCYRPDGRAHKRHNSGRDIVGPWTEHNKENTMRKINLQVGKTYTTRRGDTVTITAESDGTFVGLVERTTAPGPLRGSKHYRTYISNGKTVPVIKGLDQRDDIIAEYVEKPPFKLEVGNVYPTRDGKSFGVVIIDYPTAETMHALLFHAGSEKKREERYYHYNGRADSNDEYPYDLVDAEFKHDDLLLRAMATREAINLAFDIANGKRAVIEAATSNDTIPRIQFDGREDDDLIVSRNHEFTGHGFSLTVKHKRKKEG